MYQYAKELELEKFGGYLLSFNGARIINCKTGEIVYQKVIPASVIAPIYHFAKEKNCGILTYIGDNIISGNLVDNYVKIESKINKMPLVEVENFLSYIDFEVNKLLLTAEPEYAEQYVKDLQNMFEGQLSIYRSEPFFIEIMPLNVDKAASLDRMLSTVGLTRENTICCGDGFNDLSMIQYAGIGVAMENAQKEVKEVADYITKSNNHDGIVDVIDKFIL